MERAELPPQATHEVDVLSGAVRVTLAGEFDLNTETDLAGWLGRAILDHPGIDLEVDMREVGFMDSSGIRGLLTAHRIATEHGRTFRLTGAQGTVREVLEIVDVYDLLTGQQRLSPS
jgi:anti-anti-sigma factor